MTTQDRKQCRGGNGEGNRRSDDTVATMMMGMTNTTINYDVVVAQQRGLQRGSNEEVSVFTLIALIALSSQCCRPRWWEQRDKGSKSNKHDNKVSIRLEEARETMAGWEQSSERQILHLAKLIELR